MNRLALRFFRSNLRQRNLQILILSLAVAVAAVSGIGFLTERVQRAVERQAGELLAADLAVTAAHRLPAAWLSEARSRGLQAGETVTFRSVVFLGERSQLVEVKGVSDGYPWRGELRIGDALFDAERSALSLPADAQAWAEPRLFLSLEIEPGEKIQLGRTSTVLSQVLTYEPDRGVDVLQLAPRVLVNWQTLKQADLLQTHSRARYRMLFSGDEQSIAEFQAWLSPQLSAAQQIQGREAMRPELSSALDRAEQFLGLAALAAVLLATAAIALAMAHFRRSQADAAALMRCFGASQNQIVGLFVTQLTAIVLLAGLLGGAVGWSAQVSLEWALRDLFSTALPSASAAPLFAGVLVAVFAVFGFALPAVIGLKNVPPLRVLRQDALGRPVAGWLTLAAAVLAIMLIVYWQAGSAALAIRVLIGIAGLLLAIGLIGRLGLGLIAGAARWLSSWSLRHGLLALRRRRGMSLIQLGAFAVGLSVLLLLGLIRSDVLKLWEAGVANQAPNHFLINVRAADRQPISDMLEAAGITPPRFYPLIRARLTQINGQPVVPENYQDERARRFAERDFNLSVADELPAANTIVDGVWWSDRSAHQDGLSLSLRLAESLGLVVGDRMTFDVAGTRVTGTVSSLRKTQWNSMQPNFFVLMQPALASQVQGSYLTSVHIPDGNAALVAKLARSFPTVSVLDVSALIRQIKSIIDKASLAIEAVFAFSLLAGILVFLAAFEASAQERRREFALMRSFGAGSRALLMASLTELAVLGALAGLTAAATAGGIGLALARGVFRLDYTPSIDLLASGVIAGVLLAIVAGLVTHLGLIKASPMRVLRNA